MCLAFVFVYNDIITSHSFCFWGILVQIFSILTFDVGVDRRRQYWHKFLRPTLRLGLPTYEPARHKANTPRAATQHRRLHHRPPAWYSFASKRSPTNESTIQTHVSSSCRVCRRGRRQDPCCRTWAAAARLVAKTVANRNETCYN
ncbi:hypothetical protein IF1G_02317 [Cordyceps javanica]|uniref:Uncharacterized protein n=1 Tax=Cordyceps javanica TaxID=43265 RepID=A0A545V933_9HYPO|nr:hypothetical protein IF1G_02317 [Cordyceps javanica]